MNADSLQIIIDSIPKVTIVNPESSSFTWGLLIAFAAVVVSPLVQWMIAQNSRKQLKMQIERETEIAIKQIRASTITISRQEWINVLIDTVAEYGTLTFDAMVKRITPNTEEKEYTEVVAKAFILKRKLELLLDSENKTTNSIIKLMTELIGFVSHDPSTEDENFRSHGKVENELIVLVKKVIAEEREKIDMIV